MENKPKSSLVVSLGKSLHGTPPPLCGRQVAQTPWKWQLPSECGRPIQNKAIQFAFSRMKDKYGKKTSSLFFCKLYFVYTVIFQATSNQL